MRSYGSRGVDRRAAERLLAGADAPGPLAAVLRAAAAPAHPEELVGEQAALAAFRDAAQLDTVTEPRRWSTLKSALAKFLTVKAVILLAAAGLTGVVLAAAGGTVPVPWSDPPPDRPSVPTSTAPPTSDTPTGRPSPAGKPTEASSAPTPSMAELCKAYTAPVAKHPGKVKDNPAFSALVTAAGGAANVPTYCADVAADKPHGHPSHVPKPTKPGKDGPGAANSHPSHVPKPTKPGKDGPGAANSHPSHVPKPTKPGKDGPGAANGHPPPPTPPGRARTPVSSAHGAATAVPPSGARPPSQGG